jgi:hypothetical protein
MSRQMPALSMAQLAKPEAMKAIALAAIPSFVL